MVSNSSTSWTLLAVASSNHLSKLGGGGNWYRLRYSLAASASVWDCFLVTRSCSRWASLMRNQMGCEPVPLTGFGRGPPGMRGASSHRSEEHTAELQSRGHLVCRLLLVKTNPA